MAESAQSPEPGPPNISIPEGNTAGSPPQEETNRPASPDELRALAENGIGSLAQKPPESRPENRPDDPPEAGNPGVSSEPPETGESEEFGGPGGGPTESFEKIRRTGSRGRQEAELPPPGAPPPKPKAARESRRETPPAETTPAVPPEESAAAEELAAPKPLEPKEEPATEAETTQQVEPAEPAAGRIITDRIVETPQAEASTPSLQSTTETSTAPEPAPTQTREEAPAPPPEVAVPSRPENKLEEQVEDRFSNVKTGTVLSAGDKSWRIGKIEEVEIAGHPVRLYWTKRADGTPFRFTEGDVKALIRDSLTERQNAAEQKAAEKARIETEKQRSAERATREAEKAVKAKEEAERKEAFEREEVERAKTFDARVEQSLRDLKADTVLQRGKQALKFLNYDDFLSNPYKFEDREGQTFYLSPSEVRKLIAEKIRADDKAALEQLKQRPEKERPAAAKRKETKGPEKPAPKWKEREETVKTNPIASGLYGYTRAFLTNFNWKDKEKIPYAMGIIIGAGTNIGLTFLTPGIGLFASRIIRSAVYTGVLRFASAGLNAFRHRAVEKILKDPNGLNIQDKEKIKLIIRRVDDAYQFLRNNDIDGYNNAMREIALESQIAQEAMAGFLAKIESLNTRFQKLNNTIRSFAAGLIVGSFGSTIGFGVFEGLSSLIEKFHGGHHAPPTGIEHGTPTHGPPTVEAATTPTPTPGLEHVPTPTPPAGVNPEAWHAFQNLPAEQQARLTEIAANPVKLDAFNHWIAAHEAISPGAHSLPDILANPDLSHSLEIHSGDTIGQIFVDHGHTVTWGAPDADLFGTHLYANYDILQEMHNRIAEAGVAVEAFPAKEEIAGLIRAATGGDPVAIHRLTEALHWIPTGGNFNLLTPEGIEAARRALGLAG